jgi:protease-4
MTRHDEPDFGPTTPRASDDPRRLDPPFGSAPAPMAAAAVPAGGATWEPLAQRFLQQYLREQRNTRRWTIFFRLMWLLVFVTVAAALFQRQAAMTAPSGPHTALVEVKGPIAADTEASAEMLVGALRQAFEDAGAKGVILRINSPGGSPVQAGIVYDEIKRLKTKHGKKVYAVVEESAASGAYYIAAAADEIYADKASIVGSIGVLMDGFGATGLLEKLGVERRLITAGANKGIGDPFSPMSEQHRAYLQATLEQIHQQFITVVREGRGDRLKETPELFSGLFWNGQQAIEIGLVDRLGNIDFVAREVIGAEEIVDYTARENLAERLAKRFGASVGAGAVQALQGMGALR